jgi:hypothetical protein
MSRSAGNSWRAKAGAVAMLLPMLALSACANSGDAMNEKLAAAEAAADKAIAAQHAAEKAAATAASIRPAPAAEPTVVADTGPADSDQGDDNSGEHGDHEVTMGGEGQTVAPDGTVVPGRGV